MATSPSETSSALETSLFGAPAPGPEDIGTPQLIAAMLGSGKGISDLIFSPGRPPQVEQHGELTPVVVAGHPILHPADTARIARDLVANNEQAMRTLKEQGACDVSYSLPDPHGSASCVLASAHAWASARHRPGSSRGTSTWRRRQIGRSRRCRYGPTGRKSSTLAAIIDLINDASEHIITIEDPVIPAPPQKATVHRANCTAIHHSRGIAQPFDRRRR
jgi:twitching motility protein PilT